MWTCEGRTVWYGKVSNGGLMTLVFAPDSRTLYTGDTVGQVVAWDVVTGAGRKLVPLTDAHASGRFFLSLDGRFLVVRNWHSLVVRDAATGAVVSRDPVPYELRNGCTFSPDGRCVVAFDTEAGSRVLRRWDWAARQMIDPIVLNVPPAAHADRLDFHPDGRAARAIWDEWVIVFSDPTGSELWRTRVSTNPEQLAFSPTGDRLLAVATGANLTALDVPSGHVLWTGKPGGRWGSMTHLAFHPSKSLFAFCTVKRPKGRIATAWFGDLETGKPVAVPDPGFKTAARVAFAPDGLTCAIGSSNREFAVFDVDV